MRKHILIAAAAAAFTLSACSDKTSDKIEQAGDAVGKDIERGINNADDHVNAGLKDAGQAIDNFGDQVGASAEQAAKDARAAGKDAKHEAGKALENAGKDLKN